MTEPAPERFERGAGMVCTGIPIAYALPVEGKPPRWPDRTRWWVETSDGWRLVDVAALSALHHVSLPRALTDEQHLHAYYDQMLAAGRFLATLTDLPPTPTADPAPAPRYWWLEH